MSYIYQYRYNKLKLSHFCIANFSLTENNQAIAQCNAIRPHTSLSILHYMCSFMVYYYLKALAQRRAALRMAQQDIYTLFSIVASKLTDASLWHAVRRKFLDFFANTICDSSRKDVAFGQMKLLIWERAFISSSSRDSAVMDSLPHTNRSSSLVQSLV